MPANVRHLGHVYTRDHNAFNTHAAGGAEHRPRQHGGGRLLAGHPRVRGGGRRRLPHHRRLGRARAVPRRRARRCWSRATARDVAEHVARADAGARPRHRRGGARAASWPSTPMRGAAAEVDAILREEAGRKRRRAERRVSAAAAAPRRPRASACPRPGATATPPPTGRCCKAFAARGHEVLFLERDVPWYAAHRDLPSPDFCRLALYPDLAALDALARRDRRGRRRDRRLLRAGRRRGRALRAGAGRAARAPSTTSTRPSPWRELERGDCDYLAADLIAGLRPLPVLHRRPDAAPAGAALRLARGARALLLGRPGRLPAAGRGRRAGTSAISAPTAPTGSRRWSACCSSRRGARRTCASRSPARNIRTTSPGRPTSSGSSTCRPTDHPAFYAASRYTLNVTRADMIRPARARACACSRPPPAARRSSPTAGTGSTTVLAPGARSCSPTARTTCSPCCDGLPEAERRRDRRRRPARACSPSTRAAHRRRASSKRISATRGPPRDDGRRAAGLRGTMAHARQLREDGRHEEREGSARSLVAGGAGFIGSHLCDALLADGAASSASTAC